MRSADNGLEIELKFQVPAHRRAALIRALATRTAERVDLRARYFDTADGRLASAQMVLRVRYEGGRWVQALKGRGDGLVQRLEDEVPVPAPTASGDPPHPDPALHQGTPAGRALGDLLRGAALQPVHGTDIQRLKRVVRHQGARVEIALDQGRVIAGDRHVEVCELEMELLSGTVPALLDLARRWAGRFALCLDPTTKSERAARLRAGLASPPVIGAEKLRLDPATPVDRARQLLLMSTLGHALPHAAALTAGTGSAGHVHQIRVALRRLRTVLRAFGPPDEARDAEIAVVFRDLGALRDADVLADILAPAWAAARAAGLAGGQGLDATPPAVDGLQARVADPGLPLRSVQATRLWLDLLELALVKGEDGPAWGPPVLQMLAVWRRKARRRAASWAQLDDTTRHDLRKQIKSYRYLLEFALPLLPERRGLRELRLLARLQEAIGHWTDLTLAQAFLASRDDPASWFARGWFAAQATAIDARCAKAALAWRSAPDGVRKSSLRP